MSRGLRASVKSNLMAQRDPVIENENETNLTGDSHTSIASASYVCDGNIPCFPELTSAAKVTQTKLRHQFIPFHSSIAVKSISK